MAFGERLQAARKRSGMTQEELAGQLQVSRQAVSKWESGRGYPELEKLLYICARCDTTMDELFEDELPKRSAPRSEEETPDPQPMPEQTLGGSAANFYNNLSPHNKLAAISLLALIAFLGPAYLYCMRVLKGGADNVMTMIWIAAVVVFGIAEAATAGLVSIWFVGGAVAALLTAVFDGPLWLQFVLFFLVSIALLAATRPLARKMLDKTITPTNADRVLHHTARVTETVDNERPSGAVYIDGKTWTARSEDGTVFAKDSLVEVVRMEGVKLFVAEKKEEG
ncbi:MAG: helix-turn-helix domain-containing protein [Ruminococcaceae bacterium]|jgi:membrane protein implicated in regulation of membrane protease activity/transcriptional regulator with XRE-family HTH domain|nr:helix-turn-helix domain-containing protein [Oscillospiraceae bacterium]